MEEYGRSRAGTDENIIRRMRIACWITKTTNTHSEYVIIITFPRQQWLRESTSMLRDTHIPILQQSEGSQRNFGLQTVLRGQKS